MARVNGVEKLLGNTVVGRQLIWDPSPNVDLSATGNVITATVDSNATGFGALLYMASDGNWDEADADALATMPGLAMALESGTGSKKIALWWSWVRKDAWSFSTKGAPVYASTTTGGITETKPSGAGDQVAIVGQVWTAGVLYFRPSQTIVEVAS